MNCQHLDEYLAPYLDNELGKEERKEIEDHLSTCSFCRERVEEEGRIKSLLKKKVPWAKVPLGLRERILAQMESASGGFSERVFSLFSLKSFPAAATATLGVIVVLGLFLYLRTEPPLQAAPILVESVNDHIHAISRVSPVEFASSNPEEITVWFRGRVSIPIHAPSLEGWALIGGKVCYFSDRRVACLSYERGEDIISLYMCEGSGIPLRGMRENRAQGQTYQSGSHMGYNGLFWKDGDLLCFLIAPLEKEELIQLASQGE